MEDWRRGFRDLKRKKRDKENYKKYHAIAEAWGIETKPSKAMNKSLMWRIRKKLGMRV